MMRRILAVFLILVGAAFSEERCEAFSQGVQAYRAEKYTAAIDVWDACVQAGIRNPDLFYNLGNAYYRAGQLGRAIWAYESALRLAPANADLNANLEFVRSQTVDKTDKGEEDNPILKAFWRAHHAIGLHTQLLLLLLAAWVAGILLVLGFLIRKEGVRTTIHVLLFLLIVGASVLALDAGFKAVKLETESTGIVVTRSTDVMSGPGDKYQVLHELHEGTQVEIREMRDGWANVRIGESVNGFVPLKQIAVVR
ncbi:MAG TPA: tetratricopeptide repeat protein [Fibrobacteraceae bacterium]|nr:tetratricopeptide repeat protein [Fibrobacteraceae bacterium]